MITTSRDNEANVIYMLDLRNFPISQFMGPSDDARSWSEIGTVSFGNLETFSVLSGIGSSCCTHMPGFLDWLMNYRN